MMFPLAISDAMSFWIPTVVSVVAIFIETGLTVALFRINNWIRDRERSEDRGDASLKAVEERLHEANVKLIDERFRRISHDVSNLSQGLMLDVRNIREEMRLSESDLEQLNDGSHKLELKFAASLHELSDKVRDQMATRDDLRRHEEKVERKFEQIGAQLGEISTSVAMLRQGR